MAEVNVELRDDDQQNGRNHQVKNNEENMENLKGFLPLYIATQVVGLISVALTVYWAFAYNKGFSLSQPGPEFSWHPFLMALGMIYLMANALITFRFLRNKPKDLLKIIHASLNGVAFIMIVLASVAVFDYHNKMNYPNLYSVHSWVGLMAILLFLIQSCIGFSAFLYPGFHNAVRAMLMPYHVFFGQVIFVLAIGAAVSGINEKAIFSLGQDYSKLPAAGILLNVMSLFFIVFGILVIYLTSNVNYKRYPRPGDNVLINKAHS